MTGEKNTAKKNNWLEIANAVANMQTAWLNSLVEYEKFLKDLCYRLATREIQVVIIKKDGTELELIGINPTLIDTIEYPKRSYIVISSDERDDILEVIEPFLKKVEMGTFGLSIGVEPKEGGHIKIPLKDILKIEISKR